ncbi:Retinoid-inducible serine carboxypeptidase [Saguinus oedipus]|uniref:Carboxypeptidase n=1 Tax=Saguinus oedipus TaxID=9490 RepID=A0ABQ9VR30_SAGOE|nr:Retinoid-inducible serine carboxypeptidase [Saguinus oedipus]
MRFATFGWGGPGGSSTGFGNFEEIGPLDSDLKPRKTTWLQAASLLFVDNPVGTGFSYVNNSGAYAKDLAMVASDMMVLLKAFFSCHKEFQTVPFYIFSESYGGKMAAGIGLELYKDLRSEAYFPLELDARYYNSFIKRRGSCSKPAIQHMPFEAGTPRPGPFSKGPSSATLLGLLWVIPGSPLLVVDTRLGGEQGYTDMPLDFKKSLLEDKGLAEVSKVAEQVLNAINKELYREATVLWGKAEMIIEQNTDGVNFYNILTRSPPTSTMESSLEFTQSHLVRLCQRHVRHLQRDALSRLMNGPIRKKLKIIPEDQTWGGQATNVFKNMEGDFMKPVISIVDELLEAGINVTVYNGQLDLIVDTMAVNARPFSPGQEAWVRKLRWPELPKFNQLKWKALYSDPKSSETSAFVKSYKNLAFYWILKAGHMVPSDQGDMALKMMRLVTQQE